tara:strand:+ start:7260 stop:7607 length:348 start_codon:yes stop_codon:yes gene_type:complete
MDIMDEFPTELSILYKCPEKDCKHTRVVDDYYHMVCRLHKDKYPVLTIDGKNSNRDIYTEEDYLSKEHSREILKIIISSFTKKLSGNEYFKTLGDFWKRIGFQEYADEAYSYIKG